MNGKKREFLYDNIKGIIVYLVVLIHFIGATVKNEILWAELLNTSVALTGMSVLFFVSGFFSKNPKQQNIETAFRTLLTPYLLLCAARVPVNLWLTGKANLHIFSPPFAAWYLVLLFFFRIAVGTAAKVRGSFALAIFLALLSGLVPEMAGFPIVSRALCYFPFFLLGYVTPKELPRVLRRRKKAGVVFGVLAAALTLFVSYLAHLYNWSGNIYWNNTTYEAARMDAGLGLALRSLFYILGICSILAAVMLLPGKKTIFSKVGRNSLFVYLFHTLVYLAVNKLEWLKGGKWWQAAAAVVLSVLVTWLLSRDLWSRLFASLTEKINAVLFLENTDENKNRKQA